MGNWRIELQNELAGFCDEIKRDVALQIYHEIKDRRTIKTGKGKTSVGTELFPIDVSNASNDGRKLHKPPKHLASHGAAFVDGKKVKGHYYHGTFHSSRNNTIEVIFSNQKKYGKFGEHRFDYGMITSMRTGLFDVYPTEEELSIMIDIAAAKA